MHAPHTFLSKLALLAAAALLTISTVQAGEVQWKKEKFTYTAKGKNLKELLREFGASQGLTVVVSKEVEGVVNGKFSLLPESLIELMAASFGFIWYAEGNVLFVTPANDMSSEVIRLNNANVSRLRQALEQLDLPTRRFPIIYDARQGTALVSGPSRFVKLVAQTARSVDQVQNAPGDMNVRVFPLRFAWAADLVYTQGGRDQTIPGVANVLSQLYSANGSLARLAPRSSGRGRLPYDALRGLSSLGLGSGTSRTAAEDASPTPSSPALDRGGSGPQFVADGRLNAVIVRDRPETMSGHEATIRALDVKPGLVEIEVRVIEVNSDAVESLGIDWRLRTGKVDLQVGRNLPTLSWGTALADSAPSIGPNGATVLAPAPAGVLTTVLGDAGRHLIARVNALAQDGRANLLSSPKVMTLDNVEAVLENLNTFFVKVAGNLDVNLFDVSVGTSLRVTPLIVTDGDVQQIKLAIRIEDGALTGQSVESLPIVRRSSITTQSLVGSEQALLIAGYAQESDSNDSSGIPGLSSLPYLGRLFKYTEKRHSKVERLFLLTPKVVAL